MTSLLDLLLPFPAHYQAMFLSGLAETLELSLTMFVFGFAWGCLLAMAGASAFLPLRQLTRAYVAFHVKVPIVVQLFLWYFGVPQLLPESLQTAINQSQAEFALASIALISIFGSYVSEDLRSGIRAIDPRQIEAGRALGFSYLSNMRWIVLPQAISASAPALLNQVLVFFKATSYAMTIGVGELMLQTRIIQDETYRTYEIFAAATITYLAISFGIMALEAACLRRSRRRRHA